jgi:hypothetical protein
MLTSGLTSNIASCRQRTVQSVGRASQPLAKEFRLLLIVCIGIAALLMVSALGQNKEPSPEPYFTTSSWEVRSTKGAKVMVARLGSATVGLGTGPR